MATLVFRITKDRLTCQRPHIYHHHLGCTNKVRAQLDLLRILSCLPSPQAEVRASSLDEDGEEEREIPDRCRIEMVSQLIKTSQGEVTVIQHVVIKGVGVDNEAVNLTRQIGRLTTTFQTIFGTTNKLCKAKVIHLELLSLKSQTQHDIRQGLIILVTTTEPRRG